MEVRPRAEPAPERLGESDGRSTWLLALRRGDPLPTAIRVGSRHFVALVAFDAAAATDGELHRLFARLLAGGAVALGTWGRDAARLARVSEDAVLFAETEADEQHVVMTTSHEGESLEEALHHALRRAQPSEAWIETCGAVLVVCAGPPAWEAACRAALADPVAFAARMEAPCAAHSAAPAGRGARVRRRSR